MQINANLKKLYESMYGTSFNRTVLIGSTEDGFSTQPVTDTNTLLDIVEEIGVTDDIYINLYDFETQDDITRWVKTDLDKFIETSRKNCINIRFRENSDIIKEEIKDLTDIQKFMFIRRTINLGFNKKIVKECKKTYKFIEDKLDIKPFAIFNGINECSLYLYFNDQKFENPTETLYYLYAYLEQTLDLKTITYKEIEPYSQIVPLPGSQNKYSKLYIKPYDINWEYEKIIKNSTDRMINDILPNKNQNSLKLVKFLNKIDKEITLTKNNRRHAVNINIDDL